MLALVNRSHHGCGSLELAAGGYLVGRSSNCQLVINDLTVSRRHAQIVVSGSKISVTDLGSQNGTYVDDRRIQSSVIQDGQTVRFGRVCFSLERQSQAFVEADSDPSTRPVSKIGRAHV